MDKGENASVDLNQAYGRGLSGLNCANFTSGNCSYIDPNEFYGVTSLDPIDEERLQNIIEVVVPIFFGLIFIVGLVGNLLVVVVVAANQQMRSTTNLLILNLAIADLLFTIFCVPFTACDYMSWWPFGDAWCKIVQYMIVVTAYTSVYTLVFMSFDRYLAVVHPFTSISYDLSKGVNKQGQGCANVKCRAPEAGGRLVIGLPRRWVLLGFSVAFLGLQCFVAVFQVSWVRHRDIHLLTVGRYTYTSDQRFQSIHSPQTEDWTLQVRYPQRRDSGMYECQVSTTPPIGHSMHLSVVEPITTIVGGPDMYINKGSTMNLTCIVKHSPEPPPAIFWTHNSEEINYDSPRGGVSVITEKGDITTSYLLIQRARPPDSGKYTCNPSNANPKTVVVHVLNGEHPAAMQHGGQLRLEYPAAVFFLSILVFVTSS